MSDLRLEDLRLVQYLPSSITWFVPIHHRPVTRVEVLEALGAERKWWCWNGIPSGDHQQAASPLPLHEECGWRWVVTDDE